MRTIKNPLLLIGASCASFFLFTFFAHASQLNADSAVQGFSTFGKLVDAFNATIVKAVGTLFMSLAVVAFFYGIVQYIWGSRNGDATAITKGNTFIGWSLLALFVMFSVFGIIKFFQGVVPGLSDSKITIPEINIKGSTSNDTSNGVVCGDGSRALTQAGCPGAGSFTCWDNSKASDRTKCPPQPVYTNPDPNSNSANNGTVQTSECIGLDQVICRATSGCSWGSQGCY